MQSYGADGSSDQMFDDGFEYPTEEEKTTLRHVPYTLPARAYLVCVIELSERFCYYGVSGTFNNYLANPYGNGPPYSGADLPGAIGRGTAFASGLQNYFQFWCYVTPIIGAVVADQYLGRYKTIVVFSCIYIVGLVVLFVTSLPFAIENGAALGGLATAMTIIGLGTGGIKSNVSPLIAEQMTETRMKIKTLNSGERVIQDPGVTFQRIYMIFYWTINVGSLGLVGTVFMEKYKGFWSVNLMGLVAFLCGFAVLLLGKKYYVTRPPTGSILPHAFKALWIGATNRNLDAARPSYQAVNGQKHKTPWNETFVDELRRALMACKVFAFYPIFWVIYNQLNSNFVAQAGTMQLHGVPNDEMQNIDPVVIIIFIPILDKIVYPFLRKCGFPMYPITRITWGFIFAALSMAFAAVIQHEIYIRPPYYDMPSAGGDGNDIHVAVQTPGYILIGLSEILASITGLEYAFTKAPASMKSFIMSMFLFTSAFGSILGIGVSVVATDPNFVWFYTGLCIADVVATFCFWYAFLSFPFSCTRAMTSTTCVRIPANTFCVRESRRFLFKHYNKTELEMNALEDRLEKPVAVANIGKGDA